MRILVTGKNGQLGRSIRKMVYAKSNNIKTHDEFIFVGREELDLNSDKNIFRYFHNNKFDIIINCAAYTAVDKAEEEVDLATQINHISVRLLATIANSQKARLIHISTDYVFDGKSDKPYVETDKTNPVNVYGATKLAAEKAIKEIMPTNAIIIRSSWIYSEFGENFVKTMLKLSKERGELSVIIDQIGSPTYASDLADVIFTIMDNDKFNTQSSVTNTYHYSNEGGISWYDFAKEIFLIKNIYCKVRPIETDSYKTKAMRPINTVMDNNLLKRNHDVKIPYWKDSLRICLNNMA